MVSVRRIHAALCVLCGEGIKKAGDVVAPALYPYSLPGFHESDRAHTRCAVKAGHELSGHADALACELARTLDSHDEGV